MLSTMKYLVMFLVLAGLTITLDCEERSSEKNMRREADSLKTCTDGPGKMAD
jgi:hypothetical protein